MICAVVRLTKRLGIPACPDTLLRMAVRSIKAEIAPPTTKILGVDDWAWSTAIATAPSLSILNAMRSRNSYQTVRPRHSQCGYVSNKG